MGQLNVVASAIRENTSKSISAKAGKLRIDQKQIYTIADRLGNEAEVRVLKVIGDEIIVRDARIRRPSKVLDQLKRYELIQKALAGAGILKILKSFAKD